MMDICRTRVYAFFFHKNIRKYQTIAKKSMSFLFPLTNKWLANIIEEFSYPFKLNVTLPTLIPQEINKEQIGKHIGILSKWAVTFPTGELFENKAITTEENGSFAKSTDDVVTTIIYESIIISVIDINYGRLNSVACFSDEEIWTLGNEKNHQAIQSAGRVDKLSTNQNRKQTSWHSSNKKQKSGIYRP